MISTNFVSPFHNFSVYLTTRSWDLARLQHTSGRASWPPSLDLKQLSCIFLFRVGKIECQMICNCRFDSNSLVSLINIIQCKLYISLMSSYLDFKTFG